MKYILLIPILLLFACNKQEQEKQLPVRTGGLLKDDPEKVANIPLLMSKGFIEVAQRGKPVSNVSFLSPVNGATVSGIVLIKTSVTSTIYLDGVQVSTTGSYSWNTTNAAKGFHTIQAAVKSTKISIVVFIETIIIEPPVETGVSLTMPPVMNQGSEGSCAAAAIGYAARSAEWYYKTGESKTFSTEFLYNQVKFGIDCNSGTAMQTCLDLIVSKGICTNTSMPYSSINGCSLLPNEQQLNEALNYKIDGYYKIYTSDHLAIKAMINAKHPVIINVIADNSFMQAGPSFIWKTYSGSGMLPHCIVICGYDDSKNAYRVFNSWGAEWGDNGKGWIDYDFFLTKTGTYCYAIK